MEIIKGNSILDQFFDDETLSVHIKEGVKISRKKGKPGEWKSETLEQRINKEFLNDLIVKLYEEVEHNEENFLEIDRTYSKVLQLGPYRTVIVLPPLATKTEITIVKPIKRLNINDYNLDDKILNLLKNTAQGIMVSGAPGEGKTTFAQALAEMYVDNEKIVKTIESPRDLLVPEEVTQYSFSYAPHSEIRDILLLSRPDYTIYDEVRNIDDFLLFKDLRLTGIGLIGVIHATNPVDSIQRLIGTIEMGVIPQVIDTVIFIKSGKIEDIYQLNQMVKVPEGMESDDLSRPVIQVIDYFETKVKYEIYSYGEQVVVMPLDKIEQNKITKKGNKLENYGAKYLQEYFDNNFNFPIVVKSEGSGGIKIYLDDKNKGKIIGKGGTTITEIEKKLGLRISVRTFDNLENNQIKYEIKKDRFGKKHVILIQFEESNANKEFNIMIGNEFYQMTTNNSAAIEINKLKTIKKIERDGIKII